MKQRKWNGKLPEDWRGERLPGMTAEEHAVMVRLYSMFANIRAQTDQTDLSGESENDTAGEDMAPERSEEDQAAAEQTLVGGTLLAAFSKISRARGSRRAALAATKRVIYGVLGGLAAGWLAVRRSGHLSFDQNQQHATLTLRWCLHEDLSADGEEDDLIDDSGDQKHAHPEESSPSARMRRSFRNPIGEA